MAKTDTRSAPNMAEGTYLSGTKAIIQLFSPDEARGYLEQYSEYADDVDAWNEAHKGEDAPGEVAFANAKSPKINECIFMKWYLKSRDTVTGKISEDVGGFKQLNSANFPSATIAAGRAFIAATYGDERTSMGLDPA